MRRDRRPVRVHRARHEDDARGVGHYEWYVMVKHLNATFDKFAAPAAERNDVLTALGPLKKDIVDKP